MEFNDAFLDMCEAQGFTISVPEQRFRRIMCDCLCALYLAQRYGGLPVAGPHTPPPLPDGWTRDTHARWLDYLQQFYFSSQDWEQFWRGVPIAAWEEAVPTWRADLQAVALLYVQGDTERFLQTGALYKEDGGLLEDADTGAHDM